MIDEKKLIEELNKGKRLVQKYKEYTAEDAYNHVITTVNEQPKVGEWIPCSEGLPEEVEGAEYYDSVIVTLNDGRVAEGCYRNADKEWWVDAPDGEHFSENMTDRVIAWMPLPEPYREGDSDGESQTA